jgi:hypothetical protein
LIENGIVAHNIQSGPSKDHFNSNFLAKDFDVILSHLHSLMGFLADLSQYPIH